MLEVDTSQRWEHRIRFRDEATPTSRAKPEGVRGMEVWCAFGPTPPASPGDCTYLATDTATPYLVELDPSKAGQTAHYLGRWVNTRGETGPWSETVSATVTG